MNCPLCVDRRLDPIIHRGIEIDVCENCGGIWLDRGELDRMARPATPQASYGDSRSDGQSNPAKHGKSGKSEKSGKGKSKKKSKTLGARLGDLLEEALDL